MIGLMRNGGSVDVFLHVEYGFSSIGSCCYSREWCGIQGQNYFAWLQGSKKPVGFHYRDLVLGTYCFRLIILNVSQWSNG